MKMNVAFIIIGAILLAIGTIGMASHKADKPCDASSNIKEKSVSNSNKIPPSPNKAATSPNKAVSSPTENRIYASAQATVDDGDTRLYRDPEIENDNKIGSDSKVGTDSKIKTDNKIGTYSKIETKSEENDPKKKGNDFEGYIADIMKSNRISLKQWNQGTTSSRGTYAENELNPDFFVSQKCNGSELEYWVECKYRSSLPEKGFTIEDYQLKRYVGTQKSSRRKILIVLGTEGTPASPSRVYIIPLDTLMRFKRVGHKYLPHYILRKPETSFRTHIEDWFLNDVFKK